MIVATEAQEREQMRSTSQPVSEQLLVTRAIKAQQKKSEGKRPQAFVPYRSDWTQHTHTSARAGRAREEVVCFGHGSTRLSATARDRSDCFKRRTKSD